jgi:hypothetical protein
MIDAGKADPRMWNVVTAPPESLGKRAQRADRTCAYAGEPPRT